MTTRKTAAPVLPDIPTTVAIVALDTGAIYDILDNTLPKSIGEGGLRLAVTRMLAESRRRGRTA